MKLFKLIAVSALCILGAGFMVFGGLILFAACLGGTSPYNQSTDITGTVVYGVFPLLYGGVLAYVALFKAKHHLLRKILLAILSPILVAIALMVGGGLLLAQSEGNVTVDKESNQAIFFFGIIPVIIGIILVKPLFGSAPSAGPVKNVVEPAQDKIEIG